jgi:pantothenate synthetase
MLSSHELFGFMSPALALDIVNYAYEADRELYKATLQAVAQARHVRPVFLQQQPRTQRHKGMVETLSRPTLELAAASLLRGWLLKKHTALLVEFLNSLEIANENGAVEDLPATMDGAKLKTAVDGVLAKFPPETVAVYLHAFNTMNAANWPNLKTMLESDARLQLGAGVT